MKKSSISERIEEMVAYFASGNKSKFATIVGTSEANIRNYIEGRQPKFDFLSSIAQNFEINFEWLLTGKGEMLYRKNGNPENEKNTYLNTHLNTYPIEENGNSEGEKQYTPEYTPIRVESSKTSSFAVPFYDIPVSAGPLGVLTYSEGAVKPDGYIDMEIFRRCDAILPVIGVSMEPEIHSGDLVGIRKLDSYNWEYLETGKVYMIVTTEDRMIKYINRADDSDYIICSSPNYHDFKIRKADILEIYRVIANIRAL